MISCEIGVCQTSDGALGSVQTLHTQHTFVLCAHMRSSSYLFDLRLAFVILFRHCVLQFPSDNIGIAISSHP